MQRRGSLPLHGRRAIISAATMGLPGAGSVRGVRDGWRSAPVRLEITYSRDGSVTAREVRTCGHGEPTAIGGVRFEWHR